MLAATHFEFKYRFWIFGAIFWFAFATYSFDHVNAGQAMVDWFARLRGVPPADWQYHAVFAVGALLCISAAAVRTWGTAYLNPEVMVDMRLHTGRLVADGPYRFLRNPLYFGNIVLAIGFGLMASRVGMLILIGGTFIFDYRLVLREEREIRGSQGESYRAYCNAVPRLLPAWRPKLPSGGARPNWSGGLLGEAFMWVLAASVVAFAISLQQSIFFAVLMAAFLVYGVCYVRIRKRGSGAAGAFPPREGK